jgi:choline dehydrogenase-like flavoprotein
VKKAIVVGAGAGGAAAARALAGHLDVTVLEAGPDFRPLGWDLRFFEPFKKAGLLADERMIRLLFPRMRVQKTAEGMVLIRGRGLGGTTTLATGNALRLGRCLEPLGLDLSPEFDELEAAIPIGAGHRARWRPASRELFELMSREGFDPRPLPKMGDSGRCRNCGRCVLGCPFGAKWDSRVFLLEAADRGARVLSGTRVAAVVHDGRAARGVIVRRRGRKRFLAADVVVLAAGGLSTPALLEASGLEAEPRLFVDPVLCVAGPWKGALQNRELSMPFAAQRDGYILAPYFDHMSYFFNSAWRPPAENIVSLMIKLADSPSGRVARGRVQKSLTAEDKRRLEEAVATARGLLVRLGVAADRIVLGTLNAGHPGGTVPLRPEDAASLHPVHLPGNLYVADASLFPTSLGNPPILTIMALATRIARLALARLL